MNENSYNLIDEPWIPVILKSGENRDVSLSEIFSEQSSEIADLSLIPYERIAVFRLLLCIAQAALGPDRLKGENEWLASRTDLVDVCGKYLDKWHDRFYLYGPHAFLQPDNLKDVAGKKHLDKLFFDCSSGNNSTLFDHQALTGERAHSPGRRCIGMLAFQNFSAGGRSSKCLWGKKETAATVKASPCRERSGLFTILLGEDLLTSIWMNLLTDTQIHSLPNAKWGRPVWELDHLDEGSVLTVSGTMLGRLTPISRVMKLDPDSPESLLGEGAQYTQFPEWREPMVTVVPKNGSLEDTYIPTDPDKMPWRDLQSILSLNEDSRHKSALALHHLQTLSESDFKIWVGGLRCDQAKEIDMVEWSTSLSKKILDEPVLLQYESAVEWAEKQANFLEWAIKTYSSAMKLDKADVFKEPAKRIYWDILGTAKYQTQVQDIGSPSYLEDWKKATDAVAKRAYEESCPHTTPRQLVAYAQGFSKITIHERNDDTHE